MKITIILILILLSSMLVGCGQKEETKTVAKTVTILTTPKTLSELMNERNEYEPRLFQRAEPFFQQTEQPTILPDEQAKQYELIKQAEAAEKIGEVLFLIGR